MYEEREEGKMRMDDVCVIACPTRVVGDQLAGKTENPQARQNKQTTKTVP